MPRLRTIHFAVLLVLGFFASASSRSQSAAPVVSGDCAGGARPRAASGICGCRARVPREDGREGRVRGGLHSHDRSDHGGLSGAAQTLRAVELSAVPVDSGGRGRVQEGDGARERSAISGFIMRACWGSSTGSRCRRSFTTSWAGSSSRAISRSLRRERSMWRLRSIR